MDIEYFLRTKYEENQVEGVLRTEELYKNISNTYLKHLFAVSIKVLMVCLVLASQKEE